MAFRPSEKPDATAPALSEELNIKKRKADV